MSRRTFHLMYIGWTIALWFSGCTSSPNGPEQSAPTIPSITFKGPKTNSSDPNAQSVLSAVASINVYTKQLSVLGGLPSVQKGNTRIWT